ncbi:MAG: IS21 family transposase, partial [Proteobacteria bacterium]|nr:IS21 family transposase [Pseudomonadota bacterium]
MSGKHISDKQVNLYMTQRAKHGQVIAAAKSGISSRTAGRIDNQIHQLKQASRQWRTCEDLLSVIWEPIVLPLLQQSEGFTPIGIFDFLCE